MGVTCQILVKKTTDGTHKPGQPITGIVKYNIDEPTEYKGIILSLIGQGRCSWTESRSGADKKAVTYTGTEEFISAHVNLLTRKKTDAVLIPIGSYRNAFEFILPKEIPPSFKDSNGSIIYTLTLKFQKPGVKTNKEFNAVIPVTSCLESKEPGPVFFGLEKSLFKFFLKKRFVRFKGQVEKTTLEPGENAVLTFDVKNNTGHNIPSVKTELVVYTTFTSNDGRKKCNQSTIPESIVESSGIAKDAIANLSNVIPTLPNMYSICHSKIISREYRLKVTIRLPMPHVNPSVEVPLLVTQKITNEEVGEENDDDNEDDQPPSYWEAICEEYKNNEI